jgi:hypothetical protein
VITIAGTEIELVQDRTDVGFVRPRDCPARQVYGPQDRDRIRSSPAGDGADSHYFCDLLLVGVPLTGVQPCWERCGARAVGRRAFSRGAGWAFPRFDGAAAEPNVVTTGATGTWGTVRAGLGFGGATVAADMCGGQVGRNRAQPPSRSAAGGRATRTG